MATHHLARAIRIACSAALLAAALAACGRETAESAPAAEVPAAPDSAPTPEPAPAPTATRPEPPDEAAPPAPDRVAANVTPAATLDVKTRAEPVVSSMRAAVPSAKISVAVDLHYELEGALGTNEPATLHLAAVPRVEGSNLKLEVKESAGFRVDSSPVNIRKVSSGGVYRQNLAITRLEGAATPLRVLVTMETSQGTGFGFFTIPLDAIGPPEAVGTTNAGGGTIPQKQDSVKQR